MGTIWRISKFIGRPICREFDVSFNRLHAQSPLFFRRGSDSANIAELDAASLALFERLHGHTLRQMGYGESDVVPNRGFGKPVRQSAGDDRSG